MQCLKVGLVHNWPGAKNSELDIINRIVPILEELGHEPTIIDPMGQKLDTQGNRLIPLIRVNDFDLVLNFHFLTPKLLCGLSYVVNWNPLAYIIKDPITRTPLSVSKFNYIADCFRSHDRFLSAGSDITDNYVKALRTGYSCEWPSSTDVKLHTTISSAHLPSFSLPTADEAKLFYIGVNWEKLSSDASKKIRHEGLFETLDKSGLCVFYGLQKQYGVNLWDGIQHYKGELPFDGGVSIIQKSREFGITLVLSSEQHIKSAVVSTRLFQACAAGCVIVSDKNPFIEKFFDDNVYFFEKGDTAAQTAERIVQTVKNIKADWETAKQRADNCRSIFKKHFSLEQEIQSICSTALMDKEQKALEVKSIEPISVIVDSRILDNENLGMMITKIIRQSVLVNIHILVSSEVQKKELSFLRQKESIFWYEWNQPLGAFIINNLSNLDKRFIVYSKDIVWDDDHLFMLTLSMNDKEAITYSPFFIEFQDLLVAHQTDEFAFKGLTTAIQRLDKKTLQRFDAQCICNANILFDRDAMQIDDPTKIRIAQFDLGAVWVMMYEYWLKTKKLPKLSPMVTSKVNVNKFDSRYQFNQYESSSSITDLFQERNMFSALYIDTNPYISEIRELWEIQQNEGRIKSAESTLRQVHHLQMNITQIKENIESENISIRFSFLNYFQHLFRNRPIFLSMINHFHHLFSKLLKIKP